MLLQFKYAEKHWICCWRAGVVMEFYFEDDKLISKEFYRLP